MGKKARLLRFACVLVSLEIAVLIASLVTGAMAPCGGVAVNATPSPLDTASSWLMFCHNILEIGFYAVFAWLLIDDNGPYAIAGFLFGLIGLVAMNLSGCDHRIWPGDDRPSLYYRRDGADTALRDVAAGCHASVQVDATQGQGIRRHDALDLRRQVGEVVCYRADQPSTQRA